MGDEKKFDNIFSDIFFGFKRYLFHVFFYYVNEIVVFYIINRYIYYYD